MVRRGPPVTWFRNKLIAFEPFPAGVHSVGWKSFRPKPDEAADPESATVTRQGAWVFAASIASSGLGFVFWVFAARLFTPEEVGVAGSLVSLSALATSIATLGLDIGFVRFAPRVRYPLRFLRKLLIITGVLGAIVGAVLPLIVLTMGRVDSGVLLPLVGISILLTVSTIWNDLTNGAIMAAERSHILAYEMLAYGGIKIALVVTVVAAGAVGLFGAYSIPMIVILIISFSILPRLWPAENPAGASPSFRELATLSAGNWISVFAYSLPVRLGPALMLIFLDAASVAYFFIALQLAEVLNYISEALAKSLFAHGSRKERLTRSLTAHMRGLLALTLIPLVAVGILVAPLAMSVAGGPAYEGHFVALQLFLLATIPKGFYQVLRAQFNVEQRPIALIVSGATLGVSTLALLVIGLILRLDVDLLPASWIIGGVLGLAVGLFMAGRGQTSERPA